MHSASFLSEQLLTPSNRKTPHGDSSSPSQRKRHKHQPDAVEEELLVFGYEARLFNDHVTAKKIEEGHGLIPWQSDNAQTLRMDRFDVRHLLDEDTFRDALNSDVDSTLVAEEQQYDSERYADLDSDEEYLFNASDTEREQYLVNKRLTTASSNNDSHQHNNNTNDANVKRKTQFHAYRYDDDTQSSPDPITPVQASLAKKYKVPPSMVLPSTQEQADIIDQVARTVAASKHANLAEIRIQARQANNRLYSFLNKSDPLYPFYKHIIFLSSTGLGVYGDSDSSSEESDTEQNESSQPTTSSSSTAQPPVSQSSAPVLSDAENDVIEKTARFVAKAGPELETRIRQRHTGDPKFAFLSPWNTHYSYYQSRIAYYRQHPV